MTEKEILIAYQEGKLSLTEVQDKLRGLKRESLKNPLSEGQKGLWMLQNMLSDMSAYNIPICFCVRKKMDIEKFKQACCFVLRQYPILTSIIQEDNGIPCRLTQPWQPLAWQQEDISNLDSCQIVSYLQKKAKEPFLLENGSLMRVHVFFRSEQEYFVLIVIHHIVFDGSSSIPFMTTLFNAYRDIIQEKNPELLASDTSYNEFVEWQEKMLTGKEGEEHRSYWKQQMSGTLPILELPTDHPRPSTPNFAGKVYTNSLSPELSKQIVSFAQSQQVSPAVVLLGVFKVLLYRYTGQEDIIIGMPTLGRQQERFYSLIGYFANMIAIRSQRIGSQPFTRFVRELQLTVVDGVDHADYPFPVLVRELNALRTQNYSPLFQAAFVYQNFLQSANLQNFKDQYQDILPIEFVEGINQEGEYEFELEVFEQADKFILNLKYNPDLFDTSTIIRAMGHYKNLIEDIIGNPDLDFSEYSMLSAEENKTLLLDWNTTQADYCKDKCIHELFELRAEEMPQAIALVCGEEMLTYQELDNKSALLAKYLQTQGIIPGCLVAICMERSIEMVVAILGILKAGGAYVPLDPNYPAERLEYMIQDSGALLVLTQSGLVDKISRLVKQNVTAIALDTCWGEVKRVAEEQKILKREVRPDHLAYVIYTSGSTGTPKGVMVNHASIINTLHFLEYKYPVTKQDAYLLKTNYVFDVSLSELFGWFIGKGHLVILPPNGEKSPEKMIEYIEKYKVTHINFVPTMLGVFLNGAINDERFLENCSIKYMMVAGEAFPKELVKKAVETFKGISVENIYGPTETSIYATWFSCSQNSIVSGNTPIGKPIANTSVYIVDGNLRLAPIGVPGELCIAGDGLARGYLNLPVLTAEKFIDNPFCPGTKLYKTGDLAKWLADGNIEFLGRMDHQVKIRGYRIELCEIESQLSTYPEINDCAVIVKEQEDNKQLIAYYTVNNWNQDKSSPDSKELRDYLNLHLPEYMIPSFFIHLDKMPLMPNGKINRKELMKCEGVVKRIEKTCIPQSAIEEEILKIWKDVLNVNDITMEDGFFEIGGDSILAVTVAQRIKKNMNCDFSVTELFKYANIKEISNYIININAGAAVSGAKSKQKTGSENINCIDIVNPKTMPKQSYHEYYQDSLAIIGISCLFPGAQNHYDFWENLREGKESIKYLSKEELSAFDIPQELIQNPNFVPVQSTIEGKDLFDPGFFSISLRDAEFMDPQMRLLLIHSWKAIEDAGYVPKQISDSCVFMSASNSLYRTLLPRASSQVFDSPDEYVSWMLGQGGTIPTMISHKLGLKGPSYFVHSNCSSGLVGLHSAYQNLLSGNAKYALVGASTIVPSSSCGYVHQAGLNFSSDGHIKAFDKAADGMIGGEGVAVILLKRAVNAIEDGDHIYALIRGICVNNDGSDKVGFYAPSVKGQADVIRKALDVTKINPESVSYIEAHGTGTKLGDPIEFTALTDVYKQYTTQKQYCGIGSVKTNIGHLDTAAGLAGCIKVALSLYYNEIPPSLNYKQPNPNIDIENSPFYVVDKLQKMKKTPNPHRAALSSFGIGGTNAHALLEQYPAVDAVNNINEKFPNSKISYIIPLSAKNNDRRKAYASELLAFLKLHPEYNNRIDELAYTLQLGRVAMESRVCFIVNNINELIQGLETFIDDRETAENYYKGEVKQADASQLFEDKDYREVIRTWIENGELQKCAKAWVKGLNMDWELLHLDYKPQRISIPTYPFAQERYWPSELNNNVSGSTILSSAIIGDIHPLLHQNTSDFSEQRFSSTFTGQEFFLKDHVINGERILPGVAYLEMARKAIAQSMNALKAERTAIILKNVVWIQPIVVGNQPVQVHIRLSPEDNGEIAYEIYSESREVNKGQIIHSQGSAVLSDITGVSTLDLKALQTECTQSTLSSAQCYEAFRSMGVAYGPGYQGIEMVYAGSNQVLAKISLPPSILDTHSQFVLHPSLLDSALQASIGLMIGSNDTKLSLPFALQEIEILGSCSSVMWALIRYSDGVKAGDNIFPKRDIDICDETGAICVRIKEFSSRVAESKIKVDSVLKPFEGMAANKIPVGTTLLTPVWDTVLVNNTQPSPPRTAKIVIVGGTEDNRRDIQELYPLAHMLEIRFQDSWMEIVKKLDEHGSIDHIVWITPCEMLKSLAEEILIEGQKEGVILAFRTIKALLHLGYGVKRLDWSVLTTQAQSVRKNDVVNPTHASLHGLMGTVAKEYPNWKIRLVDLETECECPIVDIFTLAPDPQGNAWAYRGKEWYQQKLVPVDNHLGQTLYKTGGVYVVIGGAGGIGEVWSEYMIQTYQARIIWIGRRPKDEFIQAKLNRLGGLGPTPSYIMADASDRQALGQAYEEIKNRYHEIHGVVHAAIVLLDQSLANMNEDRFQAGLMAKVDVSVRIAQIFGNSPLDFVLFFSSFNSFTKPHGQSNYNAGCTFNDAFAHQLSHEWSGAVKVMNWGYWGSVGVVASNTYRERMEQAGIGSIEPPKAMEALEVLLAGSLDQVALINTNKPHVWEGINTEEFISAYRQNISSHILDIQKRELTEENKTEQYSLVQQANLDMGRYMKEIDEILVRLLWSQLLSMGLFAKKNSMLDDIKTQSGLHDLYGKWLEESIVALARHNYLKYDGKSCTVVDATPLNIDILWEEWDQKKGAWLQDPIIRAYVVLVEAALRVLPEILTGVIPATDILFPNSSMELVEGIYKNNVVADYFNEVLANIVVAYLNERLKQDPEEKIRIIEIGAGTGGTSAMVFRKLKPYQRHIQEYCYTDISKAFLLHAETEYCPQNPYITGKIFNVEASAAEQGISADEYDIAIATNVLHATKNIRQTLRNAKVVLRNNGLILLNEMSGNALIAHLTFGLLAGWWLYEDPALRIPGCPGLYSQTWQAVLESEGFQSIYFPAQTLNELGQQIIVAESNGVVRQKREVKSHGAPVEQNVKATTLKIQLPKQKTITTQKEEITQDLLREKCMAYIKKIAAKTLKMPSEKIDSSEPLGKYGMDSILVVQLTNTLREVFSDISSTLVFEYQTIDALVEHFIQTQKDTLVALAGLEDHKFSEDSLSNDEIIDNQAPAHIRPAFGKARRFIFHEPEFTRSVLQPSVIQDIAIIGLAGRYPEANNIQEYWENLKSGRDSITEIPQDRWDHRLYYDENTNKIGKTYSKWGGFLSGVDRFDPLFFNISPREAELMNPQERLFLECAYETLEDGGYTRQSIGLCRDLGYEGNVGVYVGVMYEEYQLYGAQGLALGKPIAMSGSLSSIANRVSYFCNFNGPSMVVDTMCSSSLTAIHLACKGLERGECELAIAGGVNVSIHPNKYLFIGQGRFASTKGRCESFGHGGDGYVPGEGVGAVLLKPLSKAVADGDHIYGIIKASALNHGGKTGGYTVPNPNAQASVIGRALKEAGIHPRTVSYIEAHGTGTSLGDPIEIAGLSKIFQEYTNDKQFCAIGSAKSNIGHCESASGIAGVTKVLLQLKHRQLVPSLHSKTLNPHIDFGNTPFVVQQELATWNRPLVEINGEKQEYPRIAGISAFGAGGSNAHVMIEEYIPKDQTRQEIAINAQNPAIIVLSAKNNDRLKEQVRRLLSVIEKCQLSDADLRDIAYTLQVGREAMEERLGLIVRSVKELKEKLKSFLEGRDGIDDLHYGQFKYNNKEVLAGFAVDEDMALTINAWINKGKYTKLLDLWVKGLVLDWNKLYHDVKPRRISLPTYPFTRERYWIPEIDTKAIGAISPTIAEIIHPLLHKNTSDLSVQRFSSTFTGCEFFLADHVVKNRRVLPGVACLEMARMAVDQAAGTLKEGKTGIRLKNVVWVRPITVGDQPVQVHISLLADDENEIIYEIYSESEKMVGTEPIVHSQGSATLGGVAEITTLDIQALQAECSKGSLSSSQCYETFKTMGINYGPGHRGIEMVYVGREQVLAKISLPSSVSSTKDQYILHPSLMDSALQALMGLIMHTDGLSGSTETLKPVLPFALQELEIVDKCTSSMWAFAKYHDGSMVEDKIRKLDIYLSDDQGRVCVRLKGFSARTIDDDNNPEGLTATSEVLMLKPDWKEKDVSQENEDIVYGQQMVLLCQADDSSRENIEARMRGVRCLGLELTNNSIEELFQAYVCLIFDEIQRTFKDKSIDKALIQVVVSDRSEQHLLSGLSGLLKSARLENPKIFGQVIEVSTGESTKEIIDKLIENSRCPDDSWIRYQDGKRYVAGISKMEISQATEKIPWKNRGVYLITGGIGGLGLIFAQEIATKAKDVTLVLAGRSPLNDAKQAKLSELTEMGVRVIYKQVDVSQAMAADGLIQTIREEFGTLHGIIHSAGVIRDNFILKKTKEELREVLAPKVTGLVNLDQASQDLPLDFFIFFSSVTGVTGNSGQADYAVANAFMDAYAKYRNNLVAAKQRHGQTLSINWPLWQDGGMHIDEGTENILRQNLGMMAMDTLTGIRVLYQSLALGEPQIMAITGDIKQLQAAFLKQPSITKAEQQSLISESGKSLDIEQDVLQYNTINYFKKLLSGVIKLPADRIEADAPMEKYGIDSIMVMQLTNQLEKVFGSLPKTLFFEYQNIRELSGYFLESYRERLICLLGVNENEEATARNVVTTIPPTESIKPSVRQCRGRRFAFNPAEKHEPKLGLDIAIIGVSGRYPGARNVREFWQNLRNGKDSIVEIPKDRWDHRLYYDDDRNNPGKSYSKWGGFIDGVDQFDPLFFNISPREAKFLDPQERLFLQCVYETLEDAGYTRETLSRYRGLGLEGNVGVYVGVMYEEYQLYGAQEQIQGRPITLAGSPASIANRVSYFCNFHGPCMAIDTMCSSSLTALHLACQSLERGGCEMAIAGGVNVSVHPNKYLMLSQGKFASSKGRCESFGHGGDGYVPGEGVGAVLLKPLAMAIEDGDHIYGIIKAAAINHGGKNNGYSVPNPNAQANVIGQALREAGIDPRTISYIEAHGTGTFLGDPIEIAGLSKVFQEYTKDKQFCAIGSVKSNIGHCESAAGIAGVTKVLLQLKHWQLAPSLHSETLNPNIDFINTPFVVQQELAEWKRPVIESNGEKREYPRIAGVSSFGAGGSNAHVVIQEYVPKKPLLLADTVTTQNPAMIIISAKKEERLFEQARRLLSAIEEQQFTDGDLASIAYTLQVGREAMEERLGILAGSIKCLTEKLQDFLQGKNDIEDLYRGQVKRDKDNLLAFVSDEDMIKTINAWIVKGNYKMILDFWIRGFNFDWNKMYGLNKPQRISLPTYPFAEERYWWGAKVGTQFANDSLKAAQPEAAIQQLQQVNTEDFESVDGYLLLQKEGNAKFTNIPDKPRQVLLRTLSNELINTPDNSVHLTPPRSLSESLVHSADSKDVPDKPVELKVRFNSPQPSASAELLQEELTNSLAQALDMEPSIIDIEAKFVDMGLDSIIGVEWIRVINTKYGTSIAATKVYDYPNVREFSKLLENELKELDKSNEFISLEEVLQQVELGTLEIEEANRLLRQFF